MPAQSGGNDGDRRRKDREAKSCREVRSPDHRQPALIVNVLDELLHDLQVEYVQRITVPTEKRQDAVLEDRLQIAWSTADEHCQEGGERLGQRTQAEDLHLLIQIPQSSPPDV